jgi:importin-5
MPSFFRQFLRLNSSSEDGSIDPMLNDQLITTWAKICQAMAVEFEPYLPVVMPPLIKVLTDGKLLLHRCRYITEMVYG